MSQPFRPSTKGWSIREEMSRPAPDTTMIQSLKKQKLKIKEALSFN
jgi:hypothetical protein